MLKLLIDNGTGEIDYTQYVKTGTLTYVDALNQPTTCNFVLCNVNNAFQFPKRNAYMRLFSLNYEMPLFTGFISNEPERAFIALNGNTPSTNFQSLEVSIAASSDEYLLNVKSIPFIPAMVNIGTGQILAKLAEVLVPGFFDTTSFVASGDLIPYFAYDPKSNWSQYAKKFADQYRFRYKVIDKIIYFQSFGDDQLGIDYDETRASRTFKPDTLKTSVLTVTPVNDAIVIGDTEAGNFHEDYFIGDGFTASFPLRHAVFSAKTSLILQDDWTETAFSTQKWNVQDPTLAYSLIGSLNVNGGPGVLNESFIESTNGFELGGVTDFQHGEFFFDDVNVGILGGIYNTYAQLDNTTCEAGFDVRASAGGVRLDVSGASGINIQPTRFGSLIGTPVVTQRNHHYFLRTLVSVKTYTRYRQPYRTVKKKYVSGSQNDIVFGNVEIAATADITWIIQDINLTNPLTPTETRFTLLNVPVAPFVWYAAVNNANLNLTVNYTTIAKPPQGTLNVKSLYGPSGASLPVNPPGSEMSYALGFGFAGQVATVNENGDTGSLDFYDITIPAVGSRIVLKSWEGQASIGRIRDSISIAAEAAVAGDDGVRQQIITDFSPKPRTSDDCDAACASIITDRAAPQFQGSYMAEDVFFNLVGVGYPVPGRYLYCNSPMRNILQQNLAVTKVTGNVTELFEERINFTLEFGADSFVEKTLRRFIKAKDNIFSTLDADKTPTSAELTSIGSNYIQDVIDASITSITGGNVQVSFGAVSAASGALIEVRRTDFGWGSNDINLIGRYNVSVTPSQTFSRTAFEQSFFLRYILNGVYSRRSKVLRVYYPLTPSLPGVVLASDPTNVQFDFGTDIRSACFIEVGQFIQPPNFVPYERRRIGTQKDLLFNLLSYPGVSGGLQRDFYGRLYNLMWDFGGSQVFTFAAPVAPNLTLGYKLATHIEVQLDQIPNTSVVRTLFQVATNNTFTTGVQSYMVTGQPATFSVVVPDPTVQYYVRAKRIDYIGDDGNWSTTLNVPVANFVNSTYLNAQGSLITVPDNLLTYSAPVPGTGTTAQIIWSWPVMLARRADSGTFNIVVTGSPTTFSNLLQTKTYYFSFYVNTLTGILTIVKSTQADGSGSAGTAPETDTAQLMLGNLDGNSWIHVNAQAITATVAGSPGTGGGHTGGDRCFTPNTRIKTKDGHTPIALVNEDDYVYTTKGCRKVKRLLEHDFAGALLNMGDLEGVTPTHHLLMDGEYKPAMNRFVDVFLYNGKVFNIEVDTDNDDERNYELSNGQVAHNLNKYI